MNYYETVNICLIDTPGHNPDLNDSRRAQDREIAVEQMHGSDFVIWMLGLDAGGNMPMSDIDILSEISWNDKRLYVVLNKADLKPERIVKEVMVKVEQDLDDFGIPYEGISAFCSYECKEYAFSKSSLFTFLEQQNRKRNTFTELLSRANRVLDMYEKAISTDIDGSKGNRLLLHSLELDMLEAGMIEISEDTRIRLDALKKAMSTKMLEESLDSLKQLRMDFEKAFSEVEREVTKPVQARAKVTITDVS